jgi:hypothetical protein
MFSQILSLTILQILEALGAITAAEAEAAAREYQADAEATNQDVAGNDAGEDLSKSAEHGLAKDASQSSASASIPFVGSAVERVRASVCSYTSHLTHKSTIASHHQQALLF